MVQNLLSFSLPYKNIKIQMYRNAVLLVLCGFEAQSVILRVLWRIFGPKRVEVTGKWGKLHNEQLHDVYSSPHTIQVIKSRRMRWAGHLAHVGDRRGAFMVLMGRP
jgi:hypothetical protein